MTNSEDVSSWFGKYFHSPKHKIWLEHQCFISILGWSNGLRLIAINSDSRINLTNTLGLLRLDEINLSAASAVSSPQAACPLPPSTTTPSPVGIIDVPQAACDQDPDYDPYFDEAPGGRVLPLMGARAPTWEALQAPTRANYVRDISSSVDETVRDLLHPNMYPAIPEILQAVADKAANNKNGKTAKVPTTSDRRMTLRRT